MCSSFLLFPFSCTVCGFGSGSSTDAMKSNDSVQHGEGFFFVSECRTIVCLSLPVSSCFLISLISLLVCLSSFSFLSSYSAFFLIPPSHPMRTLSFLFFSSFNPLFLIFSHFICSFLFHILATKRKKHGFISHVESFSWQAGFGGWTGQDRMDKRLQYSIYMRFSA